MGYYSLHNHTCASNQRLVDSINTIEGLIQYGFDIGLYGVALTEHETVNSHIKAIKYIDKQRKKEDHDSRWDSFKLILGNEIYLCRNGLNSENYDSKKDSFYHFILIALDEIGHKQLRQLSTRAYSQSFIKNRMRRVPTYYSDLEEIIGANPGHVVGSTACIGGYFGKTLLKARKLEKTAPELFEKEIEKLKAWCGYLQSIFGKENFFLELQPSNNQEQVYVNKWLIDFSKELEILAIVTTDSHYLTKEDRKFHKAYLNSKDGDREVDEFYATTYMMTDEEIHSYMDKYESPEMIDWLMENTKFIGERVEQYDLRKPFKLPYLPSEADIFKADENYVVTTKLAPIWEKFLFSDEPADRVFIKRIIDKCETNPKYYWTEERIERMETELEVVWNASEKQNLKWSKYFLQVADYIKIAWDEGDTLVGPGRGSGVGFYINYLLDIIQIDPMIEQVPLFYWRLDLIAS